jgi:hypothetical protein
MPTGESGNQVCASVRILLTARSVGRPIVETTETHTSFGMLVPDRIILSDADKLEVLQRLDQFRKWRSLDDKRYCLVCCAIITGWEIQLIGGTGGTGPLRAICSTKGCHSIPMDWVLPTDEVLAKMSALGRKRHDVGVPTSQSQCSKSLVGASLRKFGTTFADRLKSGGRVMRLSRFFAR